MPKPVAALLLSTLAVSLAFSPNAWGSQQESENDPSQVTWEYKVVLLHEVLSPLAEEIEQDFQEREEHETRAKDGPAWGPPEPQDFLQQSERIAEMMNEYLNELGSDRWELVAIHDGFLVFKRAVLPAGRS